MYFTETARKLYNGVPSSLGDAIARIETVPQFSFCMMVIDAMKERGSANDPRIQHLKKLCKEKLGIK